MEKADVPTVAAALAALLVSADGEISTSEKTVATDLGEKMFPGFSPLVFETLLTGMEDLPSAGELATKLSSLVDEDGKVAIMNYLVALANADNHVAQVEKEALEKVAQALGTPVPVSN